MCSHSSLSSLLDSQEPKFVDEVPKAEVGGDQVELENPKVEDVQVEADDVHVEVDDVQAEVEGEVAVHKTETVFLLAEGNDVLDTASPSSSDQRGCRRSTTPIEPSPAESVAPLLASTARCTFSGRRCSMILGSGCCSSFVFGICSCSFPVVLKEVLGRLV